ncbi:polysaccharide deacetylase family protein [Aetokthonos hydrillicola Thurmond2011]|jgi:ABC-type Zn uptake system ZnuABC Zn-binding protein ZnuA/peptidoglycan/xylan/chitin deacetylase (PgdA/CDA1 family)|uniref:Polysaccharide deacetylase family protein n=1 Tax=Aetokthonos hydrillicola Thurmond2011 TaxID=2712845 RepID=A0AAP5MCI8_9CYAN|nr:polysaccharide deacetylase family protein [Aetokthonos hydrillicola]MBO3462419.1 polysaccharide deacetylase family protein [Aetokthonos hydrillicola CCALA 1050]MDR9900365.1 polysaccharide deacetylase family protein [Aetokthonos hydrillicola Thurmond2011]
MLYKELPIFLQKLFGITTLLVVISLDGCNSGNQTDQSPTFTPKTPTINSTTTQPSTTPSSVAAVDHPLVVATDTIICNLVEKIAVDTVDFKCLSSSDSDRQNQPKPEDIQAVEQAKLILYSNENLARSLRNLIQTTVNSAPKVMVDDAVVHTQQSQLARINNTDVSIAENALNMVEVINKSLSEVQPSKASLYTANSQKVIDELNELNAGNDSEFATLSADQRQLVINNQLLAYLKPTPWPDINPKARLTKVPVIMYHDILPKKQVFFDVTQQEFEDHLRRLQSSGATPISVRELITHLRTGLPLPAKPVLLTFDDGYESAYQYVFPLLKKYNYPAAFAIYTSNIGKNTGREHVSWDQLREMALNPLVTIMAHSITHPNDLTVLPDDQLKTEILESKKILETQLSIPIHYFVYPAGHYDVRAKKLVQQGGYEAAMTMNDVKDRFAGESEDLLTINRIGQSRLPYAVTQAWGGAKVSSWVDAPRPRKLKHKNSY